MRTKILFIDRDGTIIQEPEDKQIDAFEKLQLLPGVIPALLALQNSGYRLIMVSNQDGLGTPSFPEENFRKPHALLMSILNSQGVQFDDVLVCPHFSHEGCSCRKPNLGLVQKYLRQDFSRDDSYVIGDRISDASMANNMGIKSITYGEGDGKLNWPAIVKELLHRGRSAYIERHTKETRISVSIDLPDSDQMTAMISIDTGVKYFDHMLEQLAKHSGIGLTIKADGDLGVDEHHTIEDTALTIGEGLRKALGDKRGIGRYGFVLPMDEAEAAVSLDLSGRPFLVFEGNFTRDYVGDMPTELVKHFYRSLTDSLHATLHMRVRGENCHHMVESSFKCLGRALRLAIQREGSNDIPSTKGLL
jgi:imidazoleglycerol-phosphate dehydratase / histidinol-phosphatase